MNQPSKQAAFPGFVVGVLVGVAIVTVGAQKNADRIPIEGATISSSVGYLQTVFPGQPHTPGLAKTMDFDAYIPLVRCINAKD